MPSKTSLRRQRAARKSLAANPVDHDVLRHSIIVNSRAAAIARVLAAQAMGLVNDPEGQNLPYDIWSQKLAEAVAILKASP
jgi:hypothetical protein